MVFSSKTFKKNRPSRIHRKLWKSKIFRKKTLKVRKQRGGYLPYRRDPPGGSYAGLMKWDDSKTQA